MIRYPHTLAQSKALAFSPLLDTTLWAALLLISLIVLFLLLLVNQPVHAQTPDRSQPPQLGPPPVLKLPSMQEFKLSNGLQVVMIEKKNVPLVQINLVIRSGHIDDPQEKTGRAAFTLDMLDEGTTSRSALQLADEVEYLGAKLRCAAGNHLSMVSLHVPVARLDRALQLFSDVILNPSFPTEEIERLRKKRLTTLLQWYDQPNQVALIEFYRSVYSADHPYSRLAIGNEEQIASLSREDFLQFHRTHFQPSNAFLVVAGDVTKAQIQASLENQFAGWKAKDRPQIHLPGIAQVSKTRIHLIDKPGAPQSVFRIGRVGVDRTTADFYAIRVMNTVLGGAFTSRLNQNLREKHGYTYGAYSVFDFRPLAGPFVVSTAVQTEVTAEALKEIFAEFHRIRQPIDEAEVQRARNYLALQLPRDFQAVDQIADQLVEWKFYDLPADYFNRTIDNILAVGQKDVERVAQQFIDPDAMQVIIVGDREKIQAELEGLNLGPVKTLTIDAVLGRKPRND